MLEWSRPLVLAAVPLAALLWQRVRWRGAGVRHPGAGLPGVPAAGRGIRLLAGLPPVLRASAVGLLLLALAGPHRVEPGAVRREGVPLVAALDVSSSMRARDLDGRSRLDVAREELERFLDGREGAPAGLVVFAGDAVTLVPPTAEAGRVRDALARLEDAGLEDGTALGNALGAAANRLRERARRRGVIVLLTDGEHNRGRLDPVTAARAAASLGMRVYVVAVGPASDAEGADLLRAVAAAGGGRAYRARDRAGLEAAWRDIEALEPATWTVAGAPVRTPFHIPVLALAVVLLLGEAVLTGSRFGRVA